MNLSFYTVPIIGAKVHRDRFFPGTTTYTTTYLISDRHLHVMNVSLTRFILHYSMLPWLMAFMAFVLAGLWWWPQLSDNYGYFIWIPLLAFFCLGPGISSRINILKMKKACSDRGLFSCTSVYYCLHILLSPFWICSLWDSDKWFFARTSSKLRRSTVDLKMVKASDWVAWKEKLKPVEIA